MKRLTELELSDLGKAARHPDKVFRIDGPRGLRRASKERSARKMVEAGYLTPSPFDDFYITDTGIALTVKKLGGGAA